MGQPVTDELVVQYCGHGPPQSVGRDGDGLVPRFELDAAAEAFNYRLDEFHERLDRRWQVEAVAYMRVKNRLDRLSAWWHSQEARRHG